MARLNEPPVSTDSLETLRKKLLRQNRDLAKSNNIRALRIRELENDCACMLSENLQLRGRILELEKETENNEAQRIADHALAIKAKLESQLTEWGTLLAGLGLEPPMKRHSPHIRKKAESRLSFSSIRPSPSKRRLRDIAKDIEELGHISEDKSAPRISMNPEQILALRSMADSAESPELGPPPMSQFIDEDPVKIDSPSRPQLEVAQETSPKPTMEPPVALPSPQIHQHEQRSPSPQKKADALSQTQDMKPLKLVLTDKPAAQPVKAGSKRKLSVRDDGENVRPQRITNENQPLPPMSDKQSVRDKASGRTLKELASTRKETRGKTAVTTGARKPLAAKSTNDDIASPKKATKPVAVADEVSAAKADLIKAKASQDRTKAKIKNPPAIKVETIPPPGPVAPIITDVSCELGMPLADAALLSPNSPSIAGANDGARGGTPPPTDISSQAETLRPSRRNRTAVSYAEPNLRDKMRRPTKELYDAVTGEGRYARRSSHTEQLPPESVKVKREVGSVDSWKQLPEAKEASADNPPASPCAGKGTPEDLLSSVTTGHRRRMSSLVREAEAENEDAENNDQSRDESSEANTNGAGGVDIYEFQPSSPQLEKQEAEPKKKQSGRSKGSTRRFSTNVRNDEDFAPTERASRRKSMMI